MMRDRVTLAATVLPLFCLLTLGVPSASADTFQYTLNVGNAAVSPYGPYGTVDVNRTGNTATITFTANPGFQLGDSGQGQQGFGVNVNASSWTVANVLPNTYISVTGGSLSGAGDFNQAFYLNGGFPKSVTAFSFDVTNTSASAWLAAADVLIANSNGTIGVGDKDYAVAAHVFVCNADCSAAVVTGFAAGTPSQVPDGGVTFMLLGGALVGLETLRRKFSV